MLPVFPGNPELRKQGTKPAETQQVSAMEINLVKKRSPFGSKSNTAKVSGNKKISTE